MRDKLSDGTECGPRPSLGFAPTAPDQPIEPPFLPGFDLLADFSRDLGAGGGDGSEWLQAGGGAQFVDAVGIGQRPGLREPVARIIDPLRAIALRAAFEERDAIFEICGMPGRHALVFHSDADELQDIANESRFADGVLRDEPGRFRAVGTGLIFAGPAMPGDEFAEAGGVFHVNRFHPRMIGGAELIVFEKFLTHGEILIAHGQEFTAEFVVDHGKRVSQVAGRRT